MDKKCFKVLGLVLSFIFLLTMPAVAADFSDVDENDWYYYAIKYVSDNNLMQGYGENTFSPNTEMSRAMLVTALYRNEGSPSVELSSRFSDVIEEWYTPAITWAAENQIVSGVDNQRFFPESSLTREQLVTILYRYSQYKEYEVSTNSVNASFSDIDSVSEYALYPIAWAVENNIITGIDANYLAPQENATRAQTATMIVRYIQYLNEIQTNQDIGRNNLNDDQVVTQNSTIHSSETDEGVRIKITVGDRILTATLDNNSTTQAILEKLPLTVPMMDLYGREMCYRFDEELPADNVQTRNFELGEIIYWPPRHSFVIMYHQDGAQFGMQHVGQIDSGVEIFQQTSDVEVTFELLD